MVDSSVLLSCFHSTCTAPLPRGELMLSAEHIPLFVRVILVFVDFINYYANDKM